MNVRQVLEKLQQKYPGRNVVKNDEKDPTEIICEIDPASDHPERNTAIAVIDRSIPHYHKKSTETYKVLKGELAVIKNEKEYFLKEGQTIIINPGEIHFAIGNSAWVEVTSTPGWTFEDHILI